MSLTGKRRTLIDPITGEALIPNTTPEAAGTYGKEDVLSIDTKATLGLDETAIPDDAFITILLKFSGLNYCKLKVNNSDGTPASNILVTGFVSKDSDPVDTYTNESGIAKGYVIAETAELSISHYADIEDISIALTESSGNFLTKEITLSDRNFLMITETGDYIFTEKVTRVDTTTVGGGGNGGTGGQGNYQASRAGAGGGGGGGADVIISENVPFEVNKRYTAIIGAATGSSSFLDVVASGGNNASGATGGTGARSGGNGSITGPAWSVGTSGVDGVLGFSSFTEYATYGSSGGGGGGGGGSYATGRPGGSGAGNGANYAAVYNSQAGYPATSYGSGGGGGAGGAPNNIDAVLNAPGGAGGAGMHGCVAIRMYF